MSDSTLVHGLARALIDAAQTFEAGKDWPAALLWPDPERQWFNVFAELRRRLAAQRIALYAYGDFTPRRVSAPPSGSVAWLKRLARPA